MIITNSRYALVGYFITSYPTRAHGIIVICSFYYINILVTAFLMIFRRFPTTSRRFPKIFQRPDERSRTFPRISEDARRLPKPFEEDPKMFRCYTNAFKHNLRDKLDISEIIDIFTCEDIISSHVRISYRFYQFLTTRYTTDLYIINVNTSEWKKSFQQSDWLCDSLY